MVTGASENGFQPVLEAACRADASGDLRAISRLWTDAKERDAFIARVRRKHRNRCRQLERQEITIESADALSASVTVSITSSVRSEWRPSLTWLETDSAAVTLARAGEEWRIVRWTPSADTFVNRWLAASDCDRELMTRALPESQWNAVAGAATHSAIDLLNGGHPHDAWTLTKFARALADQSGDARANAQVLSTLSVLMRYDNGVPPDYSASLRVAREGLAAAERAGDPDEVARSLVRIGRAEVLVVPTKGESFLRALELEPFVADVTIIALAASQMAKTFDDLQEHRRALGYAALAARFAEESGEASVRISAEMNFGGTYAWVSDSSLAILHYEEALRMARATDMKPIIASILTELARNYSDEHRLDEMERVIDEGFSLLDPLGLECSESAFWLHVRRASLASWRGDAALMEQSLRAALAVADEVARPDLTSIAKTSLALLRFRQRRPEEAIRLSWEAFPGSIQLIFILASALAQQGDCDTAIDLLRVAIDAHARDLRSAPGARQKRLFDDAVMGGLYLPLIELLVDEERWMDALETAEEMRSSQLREMRSEMTIAVPRGRSDEERNADRLIAYLNRRLLASHGRPKSDDVHAQLEQARWRLADARAQSDAAAVTSGPSHARFFFDRSMPAMTPGVAMIEYVMTDTRTLIFAARHQADGTLAMIVRQVTVDSAALQSLVAQYTTAIARRDLSYAAVGRKLHELLIQPVAEVLRGATALTIVPHEVLWTLPFHTLADRDHRPLIERLPVSYAPAAGLLDSEQPQTRGRPMLLALANPASTPIPSLPRIPETETEVRRIAKVYGSKRSRSYVGAEARESIVKRNGSRFSVLHVAAHGLVDETEPMYSSLLLSPGAEAGDEEDGLLEAREIAELRMPEVVVLSACDTARGSLSNEGVIGLPWAFFLAGTRHVIVSQWTAESSATLQLMIEFHRHLAAGDSPAVALRAAQLKLRRDRRYEDPLYWAPFVVMSSGVYGGR